MNIRAVPLPLGFHLAYSWRTRPLGCGLVLWTPQQWSETRLIRANRTETMRRARV